MEGVNVHRPATPLWKDPWFEVTDPEDKALLEKELSLEVGPKHPLWLTKPTVVAARRDCDDVATELADGRFAIVHLVWHGHVDQFPGTVPVTVVFAALRDLQAQIDRDADECGERA